MKTKKFKSKKEIDLYFSGNWIECLLCGQRLKAVGGKHLKTHGVTVDAYKTMFGLPATRGLVCKETSDRQRDALVIRRKKRDMSIMMLSREAIEKGRRSKHKIPPPYHIKQMRNYAEKGREALTRSADSRANSIDWESVLKTMDDQKVALHSLKMSQGLPSEYDLKRKKDDDPAFAHKYDAIVAKYKKYTLLTERVSLLTTQGFTQRKIAKTLGTSKTHVARMQKRISM